MTRITGTGSPERSGAAVLPFRRLALHEKGPAAATGVTDGRMLDGVKFGEGVIETETVVMRSVTGTVRRIKAEHRQLDKF